MINHTAQTLDGTLLKHLMMTGFLDTTIAIALQAGKIVQAAWGERKHYDSKIGSGTDLVTKTDKQVETTIFGELRKIYPDHKY
jgi:fructose-1,6-bisphosphatase/inositol monophosphatase family enzyme